MSRFLGRGNIETDAQDLRVYMADDVGVPHQVMVSNDDTTPNYLENKITSADSSVAVTVANDGADEDLDLSVSVYVAAEIADHASDPDAHHNQSHVLASTSGLGADHTVSGLTARQVLIATGASTALFRALEDADIPSSIARDSEVVTAISIHAADANAHHNRSHGITSSSDHTVTGAALDVVGLTATNTLGILTPSAAVSSPTSALLKTDGNGRVQVRGIGINGAPTGNTLYVGGTNAVADFGDGSGPTVIQINGAAGQVRDFRYQSAGVNRWVMRVNNTAESGSGAGSSLEIRPYSDAGALQAAAVTINRANSYATFVADVTVGGTLSAGTSGTAAILGNGSGTAITQLNGAAGQVRDSRYLSNGVNRWVMRVNNTAESGSDAGSDMQIFPYSDAGTIKAAAITITRATGDVDFSASVNVGGDLTIATNGNQTDRFLMTNSNVSGGTVFYDFNQTDRDAGSTGAFEMGFYRDANNITEVRMSKEVFEVIIRSGGTYRFPLEVRAQQVILAELPTSNPGIVGALYRSGGTVLIST